MSIGKMSESEIILQSLQHIATLIARRSITIKDIVRLNTRKLQFSFVSVAASL